MNKKAPICPECKKPCEPMDKKFYEFIDGKFSEDPYITYWFCRDCDVEIEETEYSCYG